MNIENDEQDEESHILAFLEGRKFTLTLRSDGNWYGSKESQAYADFANMFASWDDWTPDKGDAAVWACEEVVKRLPGLLTAFFPTADMGNPTDGSDITP